MYKKRLAVVVLPVFAACAVVGSGFAAWYFSSDVNEETLAPNIKVTDLIETGTLTLPTETYTIVLDQGGFKNVANADAGISVVDSNKTAVKTIEATWTPASEDQEVTFADINAAGLTVTAWITVTFSTDGATYLELADTATWSADTEANTYTTAKKTLAEADFTDNKYTFTINTETADDLTNAFLKYASKPGDKATYTTMKEKLNEVADVITITYHVQIAE